MHKKEYHERLKKTEKIQFYENNESKILLTATYLNYDKKNNAKEVFIVGMYADSDNIPLQWDKDIYLRLNHHAPIQIKALKEHDKDLKYISFFVDWARYYRITFSQIASPVLHLHVRHIRYGEDVLHFSKVAKYTLPRE